MSKTTWFARLDDIPGVSYDGPDIDRTQLPGHDMRPSIRSYDLSGINSTRQYGLLDNPCTGEPFAVPAGFVDCNDGTYARSQSDCTWAERQFAPYQPAGTPAGPATPTRGSASMRTGASCRKDLRTSVPTAIDLAAT